MGLRSNVFRLQPSANGGESGGAKNGATGSLAGEVALEAAMPDAAEEQLGGTTVAESPTEGVVPNEEMTDNADGERRVGAPQPEDGVETSVDKTGVVNTKLAAAVLELIERHTYPTASSSSLSRKMVSQERQTELSGEVALVEKSEYRTSDEPGGKDGGGQPSLSGSGGETLEGLLGGTEVHPEDILELEAVIREGRQQMHAQLERLRLASEEALWRILKGRCIFKMVDRVTTILPLEIPSGNARKGMKALRERRRRTNRLELRQVEGRTKFPSEWSWVLYRRRPHLSLEGLIKAV